MDLFSSVTIHGLAESTDKKPITLTLKREVSFPPQLWCHSRPATHVWGYDMRPHPPPTSEILGVSSDVNTPTSSPDFPLPPLFIKLAEPNRLRSIA
ncbi:hypothetical protein K474DRAFT_722846 [Panus rudis PR-1116 ss-1]|nr:hypothetical protein K474DRAFT_722846 [Panus rudis PR-1116 ss-1]